LARLQLTERVIDLAAAHLRRQFLNQTQRHRFGNHEALLELAIYARSCIEAALSPSRVTVAFVLERVLNNCARDLDGRPARISEIAALGDRLQPPVQRAVDFLAGVEDDPIEVAAALIRANRPVER
jgi:hypothetical protein